MINIDHAGVGNGRLTVGVTGLEKNVALEAGQVAGFTDKLDVFGFFPGGDHVPFKEAGVPTVTVVSGGIHPHFHQPTDTADTINPEILQTVARYRLATGQCAITECTRLGASGKTERTCHSQEKASGLMPRA
jgi:Zn-dependent M28 family amino/carboxypeptidase